MGLVIHPSKEIALLIGLCREYRLIALTIHGSIRVITGHDDDLNAGGLLLARNINDLTRNLSIGIQDRAGFIELNHLGVHMQDQGLCVIFCIFRYNGRIQTAKTVNLGAQLLTIRREHRNRDRLAAQQILFGQENTESSILFDINAILAVDRITANFLNVAYLQKMAQILIGDGPIIRGFQ